METIKEFLPSSKGNEPLEGQFTMYLLQLTVNTVDVKASGRNRKAYFVNLFLCILNIDYDVC